MMLTDDVQIRPVARHESAYVVDAVFEGLSEESRRLRFHVPMPRLPASFRDQLARLDGSNHAAVAAWAGGEAVGVGRLVRSSAVVCEMAIAVTDAWQGRGVGRSILGELIDLARRYGYQYLVADVLTENSAMLALVGDFFPDAETTRERGVMTLRCRLTAAPSVLPRQRVPQLCA